MKRLLPVLLVATGVLAACHGSKSPLPTYAWAIDTTTGKPVCKASTGAVMARDLCGPLPASMRPAGPGPVKPVDASVGELVRKHVGKFPDDSGLWVDPAVESRLKPLLGAKYETFFGCVQLKGPTAFKDGVLYVTGSNEKDRTYAAVFALDVATGAIFVKLRERGHDTDYPKTGPTFRVPPDALNFSNNWAHWPESVALKEGHPKVPDAPVAMRPPVPAMPAGTAAPASPPVAPGPPASKPAGHAPAKNSPRVS